MATSADPIRASTNPSPPARTSSAWRMIASRSSVMAVTMRIGPPGNPGGGPCDPPGPLVADIAVLAEPGDRPGEGLLNRCLREVELSHRLARVEVHSVAGHAHAVERHPRRPRGHPRGQRAHGGGGQRNPVRQANPRRGYARQLRERLEDFLERHVTVSQDV